MPQRVFVARSRSDRTAVTGLVGALRALGYTVALDDLLPGGDSWWSTVLRRIAWSEVFVYAISEASLDSEACRAQHRYATSLGVPALPVVVADGVADALVPPDLARLHRVDFRSGSKQSIAELHRSIESIEPITPRAADAPAVPQGLELDLAAAVRVDYLAPDRQMELVAQLGSLVAAGVAATDLGDVVSALRGRRDLTVRADEQLAVLSAAAEPRGPEETALRSDPVSDEPVERRRTVERVFLSYSRADVERVDVLAADLRQAGFDVWLDRELPGGIEWWNEILRRIRESDSFLVAVSAASASSRACAAELEYALGVRREVLRVAVEPRDPPDADLTYVDSSAQELARVIAALHAAPVRDLPPTLPPAPPVPASYLFDTRAEIRSRRVLTPAEQMALIEQLGHHLEGDTSPTDILRLAGELRGRDDLTVEASRALTTIEDRARTAAPHDPGPDTDAAAPPPRSGAAPPPPPPPSRRSVPAGDGPGAPRREEPAPTGERRRRGPRRLARLVATLAVVVGLAAAGVALTEALADRADETAADDADRSDSSRRTFATDVLPSSRPAPTTEPAAAEPDLAGTRSVRWTDSGVQYAATLTVDGRTGDASIAFFDAFGTYTVVHQGVQLELHDHGWAYVGSGPRFVDGTAAPDFATEFRLEQRGSLWVVVSACALATGICAAVA